MKQTISIDISAISVFLIRLSVINLFFPLENALLPNVFQCTTDFSSMIKYDKENISRKSCNSRNNIFNLHNNCEISYYTFILGKRSFN